MLNYMALSLFSYPYQGSAHIPMVLRWPDSLTVMNHGPISTSRGVVREESVELRDVFPTFLDVGQSIASCFVW